MKKIIIILLFLSLISCTQKEKPVQDKNPNKEKPVEDKNPNKEKPEVVKPKIEVIDGITYVNGILIVNKEYSLPATYNPGINPEAMNAYETMEKAAATENISFYYFSAFRSYETQTALFENYAASDGIEAANKYSAKPGYSEHQTGLTFDITDGITEHTAEESFKDTPQGIWLKENAHKYGFILRYPEGKENITGYIFEPWHFRYVGKIAEEIFQQNTTLEEYLKLK